MDCGITGQQNGRAVILIVTILKVKISMVDNVQIEIKKVIKNNIKIFAKNVMQ